MNIIEIQYYIVTIIRIMKKHCNSNCVIKFEYTCYKIKHFLVHAFYYFSKQLSSKLNCIRCIVIV